MKKYSIFMILLFLLCACFLDENNKDVDLPEFNVSPGSFYQKVEIGFINNNPNITIYYTTNGIYPSFDSEIYKEGKSIIITKTTTIYAMAVDEDNYISDVLEGIFIITDKEIIIEDPDEEDPDTGKNLSNEEIYELMKNVGAIYNIPPEILYAVGYTESNLKQYTKEGETLISYDGGIGVMQVTPGHVDVEYDLVKLKTDAEYNIEIGAKILLSKWKYKDSNIIPTIGNGDPLILENWYFALWAYNGYSEQNNPNLLPMDISYQGEYVYTKEIAYQDKLINNAKILGIEITKFPKNNLPLKGLPNKGVVYDQVEPMHYSMLHPNYSVKRFIKIRTDLEINKLWTEKYKK